MELLFGPKKSAALLNEINIHTKKQQEKEIQRLKELGYIRPVGSDDSRYLDVLNAGLDAINRHEENLTALNTHEAFFTN
jgi:hypothetical protein